MNLIRKLTVLIVGFSSPIAANADHIVTGYMEATISSNYDGGSSGPYSVGAPIRIDFSYDLSVAPACDPYLFDDGRQQGCLYIGVDWLKTTVTIGSDVYDPLSFGDELGGYISVVSSGGIPSLTQWSGYYGGSVYFDLHIVHLLDDTLSGTDLPTHLDTGFVKGEFPYAQGILEMKSDSVSEYILFDVNSIHASVPEPGTLALLGLGLAGIGFARRKKA